ncbi:hypothetical protein ABH935_001114 [Catenulispora sp. GAS73]
MLALSVPLAAYSATTAQAQTTISTAATATATDLSTVTIKNPGVAPFWTVALEQPVTSTVTGSPANAEVASHSWAQTTAARLQAHGFQWANARQPRTMAGTDAKGDLLLVTVDGRQTAGSEGFTLYEEAEFMRSLGAVQALNLDGGGSTAMAVDGKLVTNPSDATGERAVGDTVQVLP